MTFNEFKARDAQIDRDPVEELLRRRQMWASAPDTVSDGHIVPLQTINAALDELIRHRMESGIPGARMQFERFADL